MDRLLIIWFNILKIIPLELREGSLSLNNLWVRNCKTIFNMINNHIFKNKIFCVLAKNYLTWKN